MIVPKSKLPLGEMIKCGGVYFPEYSKSGLMNYHDGVFLIGGYHVLSQTYHVYGEYSFRNLIPTPSEQGTVNFLKESPIRNFYCGQGRDVLRHYRKELVFASDLAGVDVHLIRYDSIDESQNRFLIYNKLQNDKLKYIKGGLVYRGISGMSSNNDKMSPEIRALVSFLTGIDRKLSNDDRFDHIF